MTAVLAYLGPEGTFSHQAALRCLAQYKGTPLALQAASTIPDLFQALLSQEASLALVPAENSIEGAVTVTMDLLAQDRQLFIQGELVLPVVHHLWGQANSLAQVGTVLSHPQALAQCRGFLDQNIRNARIQETSSTAEAVRLAKEKGPSWAAIASWDCGQRYRLPLLAENIADYPNNETRFFVIGLKPLQDQPTSKTSLVLTLAEDHPGGLYQVLGLFAREKLNLSRIESRPAKQTLGKYYFFIDCEAGDDHPGLRQVLAELADITAYLRNLGSYPLL